MIERHQDYQLSIPSVPVGGLFEVPLKLDSDAPFALRRVKSRNLGASGFRYKNPRDQWQSTQLRTDTINVLGTQTNPGQGIVNYPEYIYPVNGTIVVDIGNNTGSPLTNVRIVFRGAKLFPDGARPAPSYPARMSQLPFTYQQKVLGIPITGNSQAVPGLNSAAVLNNILNIRSDSDFVCRYLAADPWALVVDGGPNPPPQSFTNLYVQLMDEAKKPFSNEPIHVADLFGVGSPSIFDTSSQANFWFPGLLTPELYLLKEQALYFDVYRDDSGLANQFPVNVYFRFQGAKVFTR
jgi:hypothetical protein